MRRQRTAVGLALAVMVLTSGCLGVLTGSEPLSFGAAKATERQQTLSETGYRQVAVESQNDTRQFSAAGQTRNVTVTSWVSQYQRSVDLGALGSQPAAVFVAISTPQVDVLGRTFNPVGDMSNRELLEQLQSQYGRIQVGPQADSQNVTVLGSETTVSKFAGTATLGGTSVDVYIHVTKVKHDGDFVVAVAIYPQRLTGEQKRVFRLLDGLEHGQ